jgi:hypothetical protein
MFTGSRVPSGWVIVKSVPSSAATCSKLWFCSRISRKSGSETSSVAIALALPQILTSLQVGVHAILVEQVPGQAREA